MKLPITIHLDNQECIKALVRQALSKLVDDPDYYKSTSDITIDLTKSSISVDVKFKAMEKV